MQDDGFGPKGFRIDSNSRHSRFPLADSDSRTALVKKELLFLTRQIFLQNNQLPKLIKLLNTQTPMQSQNQVAVRHQICKITFICVKHKNHHPIDYQKRQSFPWPFCCSYNHWWYLLIFTGIYKWETLSAGCNDIKNG